MADFNLIYLLEKCKAMGFRDWFGLKLVSSPYGSGNISKRKCIVPLIVNSNI